jgi:hypothetical protein
MFGVKTGIRPDEVLFNSQHVLFVEGKDENSIDPAVLNELFDRSLHIETLGPSFSVKSVAEALHSYHPTYYFLIDRDHYDNNFIDRCWNNFPNPSTHNLLIWRCREIENYFLEPSYLFESKFRSSRCSLDKLKRKILQFANNRMFIDAANYAVTSIREELKGNWIDIFKNPDDFKTKESALQKLLDASEFDQHRTNVEQKVSNQWVERCFHEFLSKMTGGSDQLSFDAGQWMEMVHGKQVLAQVINSDCFKVKANDGTVLQGREKINEIVIDLLKKDISIQPADFVTLKNLIHTKIMHRTEHGS